MYQNFIPKQYPHCFRGSLPTLCYTWKKKIGESFSPPRILHSHNDMLEINLITSGTTSFTLAEHKYTVSNGDLIIINAGVLHDEDALQAASTTTVGFGISGVKIEGLPDNMLIPADANPILPLGESFEEVRSLLTTIHDLLNQDLANYAEASQLLACGALSMLLRLYQQKASPGTPPVKTELLTERIRNYIDTHYQEDFSLQDIGRALHSNPYYISHVFKESTGYSPMQYAIRLRIGQAQALLAGTNYSITQIAGMVGYDNSSHFNTMFAKYIGMTPGKYRKIFLPPESSKDNLPKKRKAQP